MFKRIFNLILALALLVGGVHLADQTLHNIDVVESEISQIARVG